MLKSVHRRPENFLKKGFSVPLLYSVREDGWKRGAQMNLSIDPEDFIRGDHPVKTTDWKTQLCRIDLRGQRQHGADAPVDGRHQTSKYTPLLRLNLHGSGSPVTSVMTGEPIILSAG